MHSASYLTRRLTRKLAPYAATLRGWCLPTYATTTAQFVALRDFARLNMVLTHKLSRIKRARRYVATLPASPLQYRASESLEQQYAAARAALFDSAGFHAAYARAVTLSRGV